MADVNMTHNQTDHQYQADVDGGKAVIDYQVDDDVEPTVITMTRTFVPESAREDGVGGELVRQALDDLRQRGQQVEPQCPFVASWIDDHPDYQDLVAAPGATH
ncbi:MAG: GNAT family N-acetyltransferase [Euzebya sp.]